MTPNTVPVASNLLETKFMGLSVRRLLQSLALPMTPAFLLYILPAVPMIVTTPVFVAGLLLGGAIHQRTPTGQQPLPWALAWLRHRTNPTVYIWQPPDPDDHTLAAGVPQDEWLTRAVPPVPRDAPARTDQDAEPVEDLFVDEKRDTGQTPTKLREVL